MSISIMVPMGNDKILGKEVGCHRMGHPTYLITELLLNIGHVLMSIYMGHTYLYIFYPLGNNTHLPFFFSKNCVLPKVLPAVKISVYQYLSGLSQEGAVKLQLYTSG